MRDLVKNINSELINSSDLLVQYREIKAQNKDHIVLFKVGGFYESYFDDAFLVSQACSVNLGRKHFKFGDINLAGFPLLKKEESIKKLLDKGYKIALCDEFQSDNEGGIKIRKVVRKYTQGVLFEEELLIPDENNFLCAIYYLNNFAYLAFSDVSTNQIFLTALNKNKVLDEILKFKPSEVLLSSNCKFSNELNSQIANLFQDINTTFVSEDLFVRDTDAYGDCDNPALNAIFNYVNNASCFNFSNPCVVSYKADNYLDLSYGALRNLEVLQNMQTSKKEGTLFWVLNKTKTPMGRRFLEYSLKFPLLSKKQIIDRQNIISHFLQNNNCKDFIIDNLSVIADISRIATRIKNGFFKLKDFVLLKNSIPAILNLVQKFNHLDIFSFSENLISELMLIDEFMTNNVYDDVLSPVNPLGDVEYQNCTSRIGKILSSIENYQNGLIEKTKIKALKIIQTKNGAFIIEILRSSLDKVPQDFILTQSLSSTSRFTTDTLESLSNEYIIETSNKASMLDCIIDKIASYLAQYFDLFLNFANKIAVFDMLFAFAQVADEQGYICPNFSDGELALDEAKHPSLSIKYQNFQPTSFEFCEKSPNFVLLTGANMAGKSTLMRQIALISIMAQVGSYVPAQSARLPIFDKIFVRFGTLDNIFKNKSSFALEMSDVKDVLENASKNSLILLDELGKSTSTQDGSAIARAVSEYIFNFIGAKTIFATHYHNLCDMYADNKSKVRPLVLLFSDGQRIIKEGFLDKSYGIEIAKNLGLPDYIIEHAISYASLYQ